MGEEMARKPVPSQTTLKGSTTGPGKMALRKLTTGPGSETAQPTRTRIEPTYAGPWASLRIWGVRTRSGYLTSSGAKYAG